jgi:fructan beta-fructosidase
MPTTDEDFRPTYHYAPAKGWMNDPNGLFYLDGVYHLYYQHNPNDSQFGDMSWGHATSTDLVNWTEQDLALPYTSTDWVFSGSAVVDYDNTSGFSYGVNGEPPVVAIYTNFHLAQSGEAFDQEQALAYSLDGGYTWELYEGNSGPRHRRQRVSRSQGLLAGQPWRRRLLGDVGRARGGARDRVLSVR